MRIKPVALGGIAIAGAAGLLAGSQTWISFMLEGTHSLETVTGHDVNAALSPVSIAIVAAALALTIAGPVFRRVLGALVALLGVGAAALSIGVLANPVAALSGRVTELTGITGANGGAAVTWHQTAVWAYVSVAAGALALVLGATVVVTAARWTAGGRKYDAAARAETAGGGPDRISDWDALSEGGDPTASD
ncbi:Trp biosynthesis-associated membrane protein [Leucobacter ruminantium]|uniref:Trp biosynthesis-associated membrane protein n=1 Tax=Leucobacter ruminantium TaxID=1289170 RepID=A0A939RYT1_9MICO|nr:Trp biosynthesis-associated membrane protein [Leucobacter ruminantium]MBO1805191.1 Trp biosynthesis-associated membrane protein [Leucobacter ruminantium]